MKLFHNKIFISVVVGIITISLIMAYVPLLFVDTPSSETAPRETASLTPIGTTSTMLEVAPSTEPVPEANVFAPQGFSGLNEENQSLDALESILKEEGR